MEELNLDENGNIIENEQVDEWNADDYKFTFDGQPYIPESKDKLLDLSSKGLLYNKKSKELSEQQNQLNSQYSVYQQLDEYLKNNPEQYDAIVNQLQNPDQSNINDDYIDPQVSEMQNKLNDIESRLQKINEKEAGIALQEEVNNLVNTYPDNDWNSIDSNGDSLKERIMRHSYDNNISNLNTAYKDLMFDQERINSEARALKKINSKSLNKTFGTSDTQIPSSNKNSVESIIDKLEAEGKITF